MGRKRKRTERRVAGRGLEDGGEREEVKMQEEKSVGVDGGGLGARDMGDETKERRSMERWGRGRGGRQGKLVVHVLCPILHGERTERLSSAASLVAQKRD